MEPEDLRLLYLERMGIDVWVPREQADAAAAPAPRAAAAPHARPIADWDALQAEVVACRQCGRCADRSRTVLGAGDRGSRLLVVGAAPGAAEDDRGEPFVGRAGRLLDAMLLAMGWPRERAYITNLLKCRAADDREPRPDELAACEPYLQRQLDWLRPGLILVVGQLAAQQLLKTRTPIADLRGVAHPFGPERIPLIVTYDPADLLRSPQDKALAWADLKRARSLLHGADDAADPA